MTQGKSQMTHKKNQLPEMLLLHLRWMLVLAKLKELDLADRISAMKTSKGNEKVKKRPSTLARKPSDAWNVSELVHRNATDSFRAYVEWPWNVVWN
jgi:hypothetical protein